MNRRAAKFLIVGGILVVGVLGGLFIGHSPSEGPGVDIGIRFGCSPQDLARAVSKQIAGWMGFQCRRS